LGIEEFHVIELKPLGIGSPITSYLINSREGWILVDPGPARTSHELMNIISQLHVSPSIVFVTHTHIDHSGAAGDIVVEFPGVKLFVHPQGSTHLINPTRLWTSSKRELGWLAALFGPPKAVEAHAVTTPRDDEIIASGYRVLYTPGHASHHMSLYSEELGVLFPGSSLGYCFGVGATRIYLPSFTHPVKLDLYMESVRKQLELKPKLVALPHYGVHEASILFESLEGDIDRWLTTAEKVSREAENPEDMLSLLVKRLDLARRAWEYALNYDPLVERVLLTISRGLLEALK